MPQNLYAAAALLGLTTVHPGLDPETLRRPPPSTPPPVVAEPAPPSLPPAAAPNLAPPPAAAGIGAFTAHLASYRGETGARRGWAVLTAAAPALAELEPHYLTAEIPGRGAMVRLTAGTFADRAAARAFCAGLATAVGYCAPLPLPR
ncbi:SPOR domain-containing protein [Azospirillum sp. A39]|uniref:SPOR domain-containing protein n=1 Tax=Azospirillum sp. A39 TaxID=3462279 RepID=UPI0040460499